MKPTNFTTILQLQSDQPTGSTTEVLYHIGHGRPITNETYLHKSIKALDSLGFFDLDKN